ncbi:hypothetical protein P9112_000121 [Eukaryota sp. TZLM1-RC]
MSEQELINTAVPKPRKLSLAFLLALNFSQLGLQIGYAVEFAFLMPFLRNHLNLSELVSSLVFLAGPLSGFIVNPMMGALSDKCKASWGRRRPFILAGSLITSFSLITVGCTYPFASHYLSHLAAVIIVVAGLWFLNIGLNTLQTPSRALVTDVVSRLSHDSATEQTRAQSVCGLCVSSAQVVTNFLIFQSNKEEQETLLSVTLTDFETTMLLVFSASAIGVIFVSIPSFIVGKEKPIKKDNTEGDSQSGFMVMLNQLITAIKKSTPSVRLLGLVFLLSWAGFFPFQVLITEAIGMKKGSFALTLMSIGSFIMSVGCPLLTKLFGHKVLYSLAQLLGAAGLIIPYFFTHDYLHYGSFVAVGLSFCAINVLPFDILPLIVKKDTGTYYALLNAGCVLAQMFVLGSSSVVQSYFKVDELFVIFSYSAFLIIAAILVLFMKIKSTALNSEVEGADYLLLPE